MAQVHLECKPNATHLVFDRWTFLIKKKLKNGGGGYDLVVLPCDLAVEKPIMNVLFLPYFSFGVGGGGDALPCKSIIKDLIQCTTANNM